MMIRKLIALVCLAVAVAFCMLAPFAIGGCAALQKAEPYLPSADQIACVINESENGNSDTLAIITKCGIDQSALNFVEHLILGQHKAKAMRLAARADAGADGGSK